MSLLDTQIETYLFLMKPGFGGFQISKFLLKVHIKQIVRTQKSQQEEVLLHYWQKIHGF